PQWNSARRGLTCARRVIRNRLDAALVECPLERIPHLDVAAQPHDEQQWAAFAAHGYPDEMSVHADEVEDPCCRAHARWTLPPRTCVVRYAVRQGTMWSVEPATTYASMSTLPRSTGVPSTVSVPSTRPFDTKRSRKSEWSPAGRRVVSAFQ